VRNRQLGRDDEKVFGKFLEALRERGFRVFHDVEGNGFVSIIATMLRVAQQCAAQEADIPVRIFLIFFFDPRGMFDP
jgi:hypothetical protein